MCMALGRVSSHRPGFHEVLLGRARLEWCFALGNRSLGSAGLAGFCLRECKWTLIGERPRVPTVSNRGNLPITQNPVV